MTIYCFQSWLLETKICNSRSLRLSSAQNTSYYMNYQNHTEYASVSPADQITLVQWAEQLSRPDVLMLFLHDFRSRWGLRSRDPVRGKPVAICPPNSHRWLLSRPITGSAAAIVNSLRIHESPQILNSLVMTPNKSRNKN